MSFTFTKATKKQSRLRFAVLGPPGSGKTYTALEIAASLVPGGRIAVVDTERGSASKYSWDPDLVPVGTPVPVGRFVFDVLELDNFAPAKYIEAIAAADEAKFDVIVIDSLSHAWNSKGGALEMVDKIAKKSNSGNTFNAWRDVTPEQNNMVEAILRSRAHVIATMRVKTEYVIEKDERTGKNTPKKIGLAPVQRGDLEYEFDVVGQLDDSHSMIITKTRCSALADAHIELPGKQVATILSAWLTDGADEPEAMRVPTQNTKAEDPEEAASRARLASNPRLIELFDQLKAPDAKRLASLKKYKADSKLVEILEGKVKEEEAAQAKAAAKALPPVQDDQKSSAPEVTS